MEIPWKSWLLWQPQGPIHLQWENACHHHNYFSFDQIILKLADNVVMDLDMVSLPKITGGSRKNSFSHASRNLKKSAKETKILILDQNFLKSYACRLEKLRLDPN